MTWYYQDISFVVSDVYAFVSIHNHASTDNHAPWYQLPHREAPDQVGQIHSSESDQMSFLALPWIQSDSHHRQEVCHSLDRLKCCREE